MEKIAIGTLLALLFGAAALYAAPFIPFGQPYASTITAAENATCGITAQVTEGPYFVSGTENGDLNYGHLQGTPIAISGHFQQGIDNSKPLANVKIEIWHTDNAGSHHPNGNGPTTDYKAAEISRSGYVLSDAEGAYCVTTIYPGEYTGRIRHIHIQVTPDGGQTITPQLIIPSLQGDALNFDDDEVSKGLPTCHIISFNMTANPKEANFDFSL